MRAPKPTASPTVASSVQTVERTDRSLVHSARTLARNTCSALGAAAGVVTVVVGMVMAVMPLLLGWWCTRRRRG